MVDWDALGFPAAIDEDEDEDEVSTDGDVPSGAFGLTDKEREVGRELLHETREELVRADGKAALMLVALSVVLGTVMAVVIVGDRRVTVVDQPWQTVWWLAGIATALGAGFLGWAVYPRRERTAPSGPATYYGHLLTVTSEPQLVGRLEQTDPDHRLLLHLLVASRIVHRKYELIRWSFYMLGLSVVLALIAVVGGGTDYVWNIRGE